MKFVEDVQHCRVNVSGYSFYSPSKGIVLTETVFFKGRKKGRKRKFGVDYCWQGCETLIGNGNARKYEDRVSGKTEFFYTY